MRIVRRMDHILLVCCVLVAGFCHDNEAALWDAGEPSEDQCDVAVREIINEDRATVVDESPTRLHAVWISQECEIRAGPEYVIRKYTFYENGTFQLMRHYYAEESCSIATHTVTARGVIKILGNSIVTPGASESRYQLDTVHVSPLNRQVAHKLGHRVNVSCGPQQRWRPYVAQLIYERAPERFGPGSQLSWQGPSYNSLQGHQVASSGGTSAGSMRAGKTVDCLSPLGIDFDELRLLRVQRRPTGFRSASFGDSDRPRIELFLGSLPPDAASKRSHRPTSLQPTALLRTDTIHNCPICGAISRGTENSPPLLHEVVALPALLGGSWISPSCESHPGGAWLRRQLRVYAGDKLWTGRWDYFSDPRCSNFLYGITAAGSYVQRARRHRRHDFNTINEEDEDAIGQAIFSRAKRQAMDLEESRKTKYETGESTKIDDDSDRQVTVVLMNARIRQIITTMDDETTDELFRKKQDAKDRTTKAKRSLEEVDYYHHLLQNAQPSMAESFAAMLRGNQRREETTKKPLQSPTPTGTTELDLHVAESLLIAGDVALANRCGAALSESNPPKTTRMSNWPPSCVPHSLDAPSTLGLRARISVDWYGQYTLLLGARDNTLWDAPLLQCGPTSMKNPLLRSHLRRSVGLRFGILFNASSRNFGGLGFGTMLVWQFALVWLSFYMTR